MGNVSLVPTVFTKVIDGDLPGRFVWKDHRCVAFLSINPLADGHVLVVPRDEVDHWTDAEPDLLAHLMVVAQVIGRALHEEFGRARVALSIVGLEVPHLHIHVVPIDRMADVDFANADPSPDPAHLDDVADRVRGALRRMGRGEVA
jgi:diadenosine tetraphosphate (Ap4A) HIT family hydrolase